MRNKGTRGRGQDSHKARGEAECFMAYRDQPGVPL